MYIKNKIYKIDFAGSVLKVKFLRESKLNDGTKVFVFTDGKSKYPVQKKYIHKK